jgi:hypothetical protein
MYDMEAQPCQIDSMVFELSYFSFLLWLRFLSHSGFNSRIIWPSKNLF